MIFKHRHLSKQYLDKKSIVTITQQKPLVLVISSNKSTFLNSFVTNCLRLKSIPHHIKYTNHQIQQVMGYQLPGIAFQNYFLTQQVLLEFLGQAMLEQENFADFIERKEIIKEQYKKWFRLIKEESQGLCKYENLKDIGIRSEKDYHNHIFTQLLALSSWVKGDVLQRKYQGYKRTQINYQNLMVYEIVKAILENCQKTMLDHILRANFQSLIDFYDVFKTKLQKMDEHRHEKEPMRRQQRQQPSVIVQKINPKQSDNNYQNLKFNGKRFALVISVMIGIYIKWSE